MYTPPHFKDRTEPLLDFRVSFNHGPNSYSLARDVFVRQIYTFESQRPDPLVIDGGANVGGTILFHKHRYPKARIIGFEPDPVLYPYLEKNIAQNDLSDVTLIQAGLSFRPGTLSFYSDSIAAGRFSNEIPADDSKEWTRKEVPSVRLGDYLEEEVDFLKLNVEGAEWEVLSDSEGRIRQVREMVVAYHHEPGLPRTLHDMLHLLHRNGFEYYVRNLPVRESEEAGPMSKLGPDTRYYLLIYAKRM
jgi:FkbM family methyltransferase